MIRVALLLQLIADLIYFGAGAAKVLVECVKNSGDPAVPEVAAVVVIRMLIGKRKTALVVIGLRLGYTFIGKWL